MISLRSLSNLYRSVTFHLSPPTNHLGRWKIENVDKTNLKADYANHDHCSCSFTEQNKEDEYSMYLVEFVEDYKKK